MSVEAEEISQVCSFPWYFCYPVRIVPVGLVELWHFFNASPVHGGTTPAERE